MSATTDPMPNEAQPATIMGRYQQVLRHRYLLMGALVIAILASLLLDFTLGPSGLPLDTLWQTLIDPASANAGTRGDRVGHSSAVCADGAAGRHGAGPGGGGDANHPQ
ncbi:Uncharacterised protein [Cedecea neteri]|uniref:Uncharacterized protein n=1 Tax=Cedecea neteri TaxID=158822 RepID=A0A2X3J5A6_9ENTR|nr:Uncharacterised protein [Cedecea neteri]